MSKQEALRFISRIEEDLVLQSELRGAPVGDLNAVVAVAAKAGFTFDVDELRAAFAIDWKLRRRFYSRP